MSTYAERQETVIGYMDNGGRVRCVKCSTDGLPMLAHMLASPADKCETCQGMLVCPSCGPGFRPSHDGSPRCESGSLASGGIHAHCTCDTCF